MNAQMTGGSRKLKGSHSIRHWLARWMPRRTHTGTFALFDYVRKRQPVVTDWRLGEPQTSKFNVAGATCALSSHGNGVYSGTTLRSFHLVGMDHGSRMAAFSGDCRIVLWFLTYLADVRRGLVSDSKLLKNWYNTKLFVL
jgi:hypothetical protein